MFVIDCGYADVKVRLLLNLQPCTSRCFAYVVQVLLWHPCCCTFSVSYHVKQQSLVSPHLWGVIKWVASKVKTKTQI